MNPEDLGVGDQVSAWICGIGDWVNLYPHKSTLSLRFSQKCSVQGPEKYVPGSVHEGIVCQVLDWGFL
eukprot:CAMPEP_0197672408 /NCGR_PEP_ID=MMETSP1338-20131121/78896_1 /TAXON_ID=43686 ORGANISM="Pelagodinium beii, Strain RCC1491" /NCGR_SAMPLE_ID=MMETSP1338 /ASSEMBLY_ACC=CAM_ASM_000754 /LENGTH=67 /DNA_ID=CAMNT_0043252507 /DNA_START=29 /DNA_END=229 /DNA_ORIENTATION=-